MKKKHIIYPDFPTLEIPPQTKDGEEAYFNYKVDKQDELSVVEGRHLFIDENGYVFNHFQILPFSFFLRKKIDWLSSFKFIQKSILTKEKTKIAEAIWVYDIWIPGYFHWFSDALHRYYQIVIKLQKKLPLILPAELKNQKFIVDSLATLNIKAHWIKSGTLASVERLYTVDYLYCPGTFTINAMKTQRQEVLSKCISGVEQHGRKIYISRGKAKIRKVINEEALFPILTEFGFEIYYLEDMPWQDQVKLLASASTLLSLHGAGLTNMMWMPPESQVIEMRMKGSVEQWAYYEMAATFKHKYYYLLCEPSQKGATPHDGDVIVDPHSLYQLLENHIIKHH